jgi:glycine/serine hydroxymethyltransferase
MGALKNYLASDTRTGKPAIRHFPCEATNPYKVDADETKRLIAESRPDLLVFGRSVILHAEPVREIVQFIQTEFGTDNPERPLVMYDGAHVLGLIGPDFQDPLAEGVDILTGSTHKTFFGPQRGVILSNIEPGSAFYPLWLQIEARTFPGHVSNHHLGTMLGLLGASYEMIRFRDEYPRQVISNAKAFAKALTDYGLAVEGDPDCGFTQTHQVVLRVDKAQGKKLAVLLEANNIITNAQALYDDANFAAASGLRLGTQEMTRYGMKEADFSDLAGLITDIINNGAKIRGAQRNAVAAFRSKFTQMHYCL